MLATNQFWLLYIHTSCYVRTSLHYADKLDCLIFFSFPSSHQSPYDTIWWPCFVRYNLTCLLGSSLYDINLRATHTMILSTRGVMIPIYLVSSTTDSIRRSVVLFKTVTILTSDPKSEFLCQLSLCCAEPTDPLNTSYAWDISHALITTYHLYCHSPSALTEYLKQKLRIQRAKRLGRSPSAQVERDIPLKCNTSCPGDAWHSRAATCQSPPLVQEVSVAASSSMIP